MSANTFMGYTREQLEAMSEDFLLTTAFAVGTGTMSQLLNVPANKQAYIWELTASPSTGTEQNLLVYSGESGDTNTLLIRQRIPDISNDGPLHMGGDPCSPIAVVRPVWQGAATGTEENSTIGMQHETDAINVNGKFFLLPA